MQINMIKNSEGAWVPSHESDYEKSKLFKVNKEYSFTAQAVDVRSLHKKYFALVKMLFHSQSEYKLEVTFRKNLEMDSGYFNIVEYKGIKMKVPASLAFGEIEEEDWVNLYNQILIVAYEKYGLSNDTVENNLKTFM